MSKLKYTFGPVPSRRLGYSLGVDIIPMKTCNLNCVYCELGRSTDMTMTLKEYIPADVILAEIKQVIDSGERIDYITFSGSGEPTLNTAMGDMIRGIKAMTDIPVSVLTNGTLFYMPEVREMLYDADLVIPPLDAVSREAFRKVDRPHGHLDIERIVEGIITFRHEYKGPIWLEILFVKDINDSPQEVKLLAEVAEKIDAELVQLNTIVRPPAESNVEPLTEVELEAIRTRFHCKTEVIAHFKRDDAMAPDLSHEDRIYDLIIRRPVTCDELVASLSLTSEIVEHHVAEMLDAGRIMTSEYSGELYYTSPRQKNRPVLVENGKSQ
ncbi:MAG: radical SAM protein [Calditrichaeota bacterium]|nr:MAG: radical SAM protein [Calditrichota bacterium]